MSYYTDLGATKPKAARDHRAATTGIATTAPATSGGMPKMVIFAGLGAAALVAVMLLKKKRKGAAAAPSISLFAAPKVA